MTMRVALVGPPWRVDRPFEKDIGTLKRLATNNTGNMAFAYAIATQLGVDSDPLGWGADPAAVRDEYDIIVVMAANQIQPLGRNFEALGRLNHLLEKSNLPIVVIGLGSQAPHGARIEEMDPYSGRMLEILRDRNAHLSIRGNFTAEILEANGISNYVLTGCPSNFINRRHDLGTYLERSFRALSDVDQLVINCDVRPGLRDVVPHLVRLLESGRGAWVTQVYPEIAFVRGDRSPSVMKVIHRWGSIMKPGADPSQVEKFLLDHCHYFVDIEQWMEFLVRFNLSTGTRLHGNMLAWQSGVPAVWIPHDERTAELAQIMCLPTMDRKKLHAGMTLREFIDQCHFDGEAYDARRRVLMRRYVDLLRGAGLEIASRASWVREMAVSASA